MQKGSDRKQQHVIVRRSVDETLARGYHWSIKTGQDIETEKNVALKFLDKMNNLWSVDICNIPRRRVQVQNQCANSLSISNSDTMCHRDIEENPTSKCHQVICEHSECALPTASRSRYQGSLGRYARTLLNGTEATIHWDHRIGDGLHSGESGTNIFQANYRWIGSLS